MKQCELCSQAARMYCESDQASLCWDCDAKVHSANFLVAKHSRSLLCRSCQSPTPWRADGPRLGPTVSICHRCSEAKAAAAQSAVSREVDDDEEMIDEEDDEEEDDESEDEDDEEEEVEEEEEGENQVVPWSMTPPPPVASSSSSSDDDGSGRRRVGGGVLSKRMRGNGGDVGDSQDDIGCSSSQMSYLPPAPSMSRSACPLVRNGETSSVVGGGGGNHFRQMRRSGFMRPGPAQFSSSSQGVAGFDGHVQRDQRAVDARLSSSSVRPR